MQFYLISDNVDTQLGMRLAGIDGVIVHESERVKEELEKAFANDDIGVVLITEKLVKMCEELVYNLKLNRKRPLIVEIPDRHATSQVTTSMSKYVQEAIGIKI